jgi:hypothetical protein
LSGERTDAAGELDENARDLAGDGREMDEEGDKGGELTEKPPVREAYNVYFFHEKTYFID